MWPLCAFPCNIFPVSILTYQMLQELCRAKRSSDILLYEKCVRGCRNVRAEHIRYNKVQNQFCNNLFYNRITVLLSFGKKYQCFNISYKKKGIIVFPFNCLRKRYNCLFSITAYKFGFKYLLRNQAKVGSGITCNKSKANVSISRLRVKTSSYFCYVSGSGLTRGYV